MDFVAYQTTDGARVLFSEFCADMTVNINLFRRAQAEGKSDLALQLYNTLVDQTNELIGIYNWQRGKAKRTVGTALKQLWGVKRLDDIKPFLRAGIARRKAL